MYSPLKKQKKTPKRDLGEEEVGKATPRACLKFFQVIMSPYPFICYQNQPPVTNPIYAQRPDPPQGKFLPMSRGR